MKNLSYSDVTYTPRVPLILLVVKKIKRDKHNFDFVLLSLATLKTQKV